MSEETRQKLISIGKGALIAAAGAVVPFLGQLAGVLDDGTAVGAVLGAVAAVLTNVARKFLLK